MDRITLWSLGYSLFIPCLIAESNEWEEKSLLILIHLKGILFKCFYSDLTKMLQYCHLHL